MGTWDKMFGTQEKQSQPVAPSGPVCGECGKAQTEAEILPDGLAWPHCDTCGKSFCTLCAKVTLDPELTKKHGGLVILCPLCQAPIYKLMMKT